MPVRHHGVLCELCLLYIVAGFTNRAAVCYVTRMAALPAAQKGFGAKISGPSEQNDAEKMLVVRFVDIDSNIRRAALEAKKAKLIDDDDG
jgi:hypothetical protein